METEALIINTCSIMSCPSEDITVRASDFEILFETYFDRVYNFVAYRINNHFDIEELVSQTFEKVFAKYGSYDENRSPVEAWIIGIAKNVVNDYYRKLKRHTVLSLDTFINYISGHGSPDEIAVRNEENEMLIKALSKLSQRERTIVAMKYAARLKNKDIALIMGITDSNTGAILHRSISKLRKEMGGDRSDERKQ